MLPSRFQLTGRSAATDMSAMSSMRSSGSSPIHGNMPMRRARVLPDDARECEELLRARAARRNRACRRRRSARCPTRTRSRAHRRRARRASSCSIASICVGGGGALGGVVTHDGATDRGVAGEEARVRHQRAVETRPGTRRTSASPTCCPARARSWGCPRPPTSAGARSRRPHRSSSGRQREAAVAADDGRDAVQR